MRHPLTAAELRDHLVSLDPHRIAAELFALAYPWRPIIMGSTPAHMPSHRTMVARWLQFHTGHSVAEVDTERTEPFKVHPAHVPGLMFALSESICT